MESKYLDEGLYTWEQRHQVLHQHLYQRKLLASDSAANLYTNYIALKGELWSSSSGIKRVVTQQLKHTSRITLLVINLESVQNVSRRRFYSKLAFKRTSEKQMKNTCHQVETGLPPKLGN